MDRFQVKAQVYGVDPSRVTSCSMQVLEALGSGTYGQVSKVRRLSDGRVLVLKQVPLDGLSDDDRMETLNEVPSVPLRCGYAPNHALPVCGQCDVMRQVEHFNVIRYDEFFVHVDPFLPPATCVTFVSVKQFLRQQC